ncbi:MAG TPA: MFS transporter [Anaerolineaceae bacterium]|nr:MFS transporter [Anaerolineaceae bacterium]
METSPESPAALNETRTARQAPVLYRPRNYRLGVANGVLYILSEALLDPTLVLVAFLSHLTQNPILLGLVLPIRDGSWALPQLWVSGRLQSMRRKLPFYRWNSVLRIAAWFSLALAINFIHDPAWLLVAFFLTFTIASLFSGMSGLPFLEVVGKTIPPNRRGEFFAYRFGLGGLASIGGSFLVRWLLDASSPLPFPYNFGLLSFMYFLFGSIALMLFGLVKEPPDAQVLPRASVLDQFKGALTFVRIDSCYRRFIGMQSALMVAGCATPFFAVYVQRQLGGPKEMVGVYLAVTVTTNLAANLLFGRVSLKNGNQRVMALAILAGLGMSGLVLALFLAAGPLRLSGLTASYLLIPVFILYGLRGTGIGVASNSLLLEIAPASSRSLYLGFYNTFIGLVILATGTSGVALSLLGFEGLVAVTIAAHLLALWASRGIHPAGEQVGPQNPGD